MTDLEIAALPQKTDEECVALATNENGVLDAEKLLIILLNKYLEIEKLSNEQD